MPSQEDRLIELETRVAFQEDSIQSLSDTIASQQREIDALTTMVKLINGQLKSLADAPQSEAGQEPPPPHY